MNVVPATSSASAPGAGALPGSASGAAPGVGPSFADVLRLLAGDTPSENTSSRSSRAAGAGDGAHPTTDAEAAGDDLASASADLTATTGAIAVPVALVLPPVTELPPAVVAGDAPASEDPALSTGRASLPGSAPALGPMAAAAMAIARGGTTRPGANAGGEREFVLPDVSADVATDAVDAAPETNESARAARRARDLTAALGGVAPDAVSGTVRRGWPVPAPGSEPSQVELPPIEPSAQAAVNVPPLPSPSVSTPASISTSTWLSPSAANATSSSTGEAAVTEAPAAMTPLAAALAARLTTEATRTPGRATGAASAAARRLDAGPAAAASPVPAGVADAALPPNATAASAGAMALDLEGLSAEVTGQVAPAVAAALRGQHPGLTAALRAFQQAGAPVAAGGSGEAQTEPLTAAVKQVVAAARDAASTGGEADRMPATDRPFASLAPMAAAMIPSLGGDLRVGAGLGPSARLDTPTLATLTPAEGEDVHAQLVQSIRVQWSGGAGEARVRLRPEHLGEVVATIKVEQGAVTATLQAERPDVRRWLETHTQTLRDGLVEHGLKLDRLVVLTEPARGDTRDDTQGRARGRHPQQPQPRPRRPRPDDGGATFELNT